MNESRCLAVACFLVAAELTLPLLAYTAWSWATEDPGSMMRDASFRQLLVNGSLLPLGMALWLLLASRWLASFPNGSFPEATREAWIKKSRQLVIALFIVIPAALISCYYTNREMLGVAAWNYFSPAYGHEDPATSAFALAYLHMLPILFTGIWAYCNLRKAV